jgi:hypothetical protein
MTPDLQVIDELPDLDISESVWPCDGGVLFVLVPPARYIRQAVTLLPEFPGSVIGGIPKVCNVAVGLQYPAEWARFF